MAIESGNISLQEGQKLTRLERVGLWIHEHPTTIKVLKISGLILGIGLLAALPFTVPMLGIGAIVGLAITGALLTLAASVAIFALDLIVPPHHDMKNHVYKPGHCDGGKLYYEGDVPVLSLDSDDPLKAGKAHGYLCGDAIDRLFKRFDLALHTLMKQPRAHQLPNTLAEMRRVIPTRFLQEIEGLVDGYNQWAREQRFWRSPKKLTVDDALLIHLLPDSLHFQAGSFEHGLAAAPRNRELAVACSAIIDRDPQKGFVFARNMDWLSCGLAGAYSLVINRKHTNGLRSTVEVGMPGLAGTITGMNDQGLSMAMNVCSGHTETIRGMPASLYNRACLEGCATVPEVEAFTRHQSPLGAYHLTVADRNQAESVHFYQSAGGGHVIRRWEENHPLSTLNCRYEPQAVCHMHYSMQRQELVDAFFQKREQPLENVLSLPFVNNWITTHRVVMEPQTRTFKVAFDNAFAGKAPLHSVPTQRLFPIPVNPPAEIPARRETLRTSGHDACESTLARVYQLVTGNASSEEVQRAFSQLQEAMRNAIFYWVWVEAGRPMGDAQWGEHHAFDQMSVLGRALRAYVRELFGALGNAQRNAVYGHVYDLARAEPGAERVNFASPRWGEEHAQEHIPRLIDAIMRRLRQESAER